MASSCTSHEEDEKEISILPVTFSSVGGRFSATSTVAGTDDDGTLRTATLRKWSFMESSEAGALILKEIQDNDNEKIIMLLDSKSRVIELRVEGFVLKKH